MLFPVFRLSCVLSIQADRGAAPVPGGEPLSKKDWLARVIKTIMFSSEAALLSQSLSWSEASALGDAIDTCEWVRAGNLLQDDIDIAERYDQESSTTSTSAERTVVSFSHWRKTKLKNRLSYAAENFPSGCQVVEVEGVSIGIPAEVEDVYNFWLENRHNAIGISALLSWPEVTSLSTQLSSCGKLRSELPCLTLFNNLENFEEELEEAIYIVENSDTFSTLQEKRNNENTFMEGTFLGVDRMMEDTFMDDRVYNLKNTEESIHIYDDLSRSLATINIMQNKRKELLRLLVDLRENYPSFGQVSKV